MEQFRLRIFEAVWATGSCTKAARQLGLTQPAVSQNIAELEKELGVVLFSRAADGSQAGPVKGGKMTPTPAAELFMRFVRRVLKDYEDIRTLFNTEAASCGEIRIRADRSATEHALPKVMDVLKTAYPNVDFEVIPPDDESGDANVVISTVAVEQRDGVSLHFEAFGPATPFVEAVRLILSDF